MVDTISLEQTKACICNCLPTCACGDTDLGSGLLFSQEIGPNLLLIE